MAAREDKKDRLKGVMTPHFQKPRGAAKAASKVTGGKGEEKGKGAASSEAGSEEP